MDFVGLNGKQLFEFSFDSPLHWFDWVANPSIKLAAFLLFAHPSGRNFRRRQKTPLFQRDIQSLSSSSAASLSFVWAFYNIWLGHAMIVFYGGTWLSVHANLWLTLTKSNSLPSIYNSKYLSCRYSSDHNSRLASIWFFCHLMKYIFTLISIVRPSLYTKNCKVQCQYLKSSRCAHYSRISIQMFWIVEYLRKGFS